MEGEFNSHRQGAQLGFARKRCATRPRNSSMERKRLRSAWAEGSEVGLKPRRVHRRRRGASDVGLSRLAAPTEHRSHSRGIRHLWRPRIGDIWGRFPQNGREGGRSTRRSGSRSLGNSMTCDRNKSDQNRTDVHAIQALSQLSYSPVYQCFSILRDGFRSWGAEKTCQKGAN